MKHILALIIAVSALMLGCVPHPHDDGHHDGDNTATIESELSKIAQLAYEERLKESDFTALASLVGDAHTEKIDEMKALARHGKFEHVQHLLGMAQKSFIKEGELLCPAHDLGHYYVFVDLGEKEIADHLLAEVKGQLPTWTALAEAYDEKSPGSLRYKESLDEVNRHLNEIDAGDKFATEEEIQFLTGVGSICFTSTGDVEEHAHEESHDEHEEGDEHSEEEHDETKEEH